MIHAHMLIEVKHYTKIHLDVDNKLPGSSKEDLDHIKAYILKEEQV